MKKKSLYILAALLLYSLLFTTSCSDDDEDNIDTENVNRLINPVKDLIAKPTSNENELLVSWINTEDKYISQVEITYKLKNYLEKSTASPILLEAKSGEESSYKLIVPQYGNYDVSVTAITKYGKRSAPMTVQAIPLRPADFYIPVFLQRADSLMSSFISKCLTGQYDVWNSSYPNATGPYWGGAAAVWGQGGAYSGYTAVFKAARNYPYFKLKYESLEKRLMTSLDKFRNTNNGKGVEAYGTYMGGGDERYYDDNVWIGIDMVDMYVITKNEEYLKRALMVWDFLLEGTDDIMGGGVYWKESAKSKHTCSTAPTAVMAAKLYLATGDNKYLDAAKELYTWCKKILQDPTDYLYWDNARLSDENDPDSEIKIEKAKYSYNSGQPMLAATLLYQITGESHYLTDARDIAESAYKKWFQPFYSYVLNESFNIMNGNTWFNAVMSRGYFELYKVDGNRKYVTAIEKTMANAWLSNCRDQSTSFLSGDFSGQTTNDSWGTLELGACAELLGLLAVIEDSEASNK